METKPHIRIRKASEQDIPVLTEMASKLLQEIQLADAPPAEGREQGEESYAGRRWQWQTEVQATSEPEMLRITVRVAPRPERGLRGKIDLIYIDPEFVGRGDQWVEPGDTMISMANSYELVRAAAATLIALPEHK